MSEPHLTQAAAIRFTPSPSVARSRCESALYVIFLALMVWAPLPFASNRVWAGSALFAALALVLMAWLVLYLRGAVAISPQRWQALKIPLGFLLLVQGWVWLQLLSLPAAWVELLSPQAYAWQAPGETMSLSLDREQGRYYLLRGGIATLGLVLAGALLSSEHRLRQLLLILVLSGAAQALYGVFMTLSGVEHGFLVPKYVGVGSATGTFVNANHLAGYLVMCAACALGLMVAHRDAGRAASGFRQWSRRLLQFLLGPLGMLRIALLCMVVALVLTHSRMGNTAFFFGLLLASSLYALAVPGRRKGFALLFASIVVVDLVLVGGLLGPEGMARQLVDTQLELEPRRWSSLYGLSMLADFPLTGSGGGSFYGVFPHYQGEQLDGYHVHAHNDYLEFATELGIPIAGVLVAFGVLSMLAAWRLLGEGDRLRCGVGFAVLMTGGWAAVHSLADFNLQIPANSLTFVVIMTLPWLLDDRAGMGTSSP